MGKREALVALNMVEGLGPVKVRALLDRFEDPECLFHLSTEQLTSVKGIGPALASRLDQADMQALAETELERAAQDGVRVLTRMDEDYPAALHHLYDPPLVLYIKGTLTPGDERGLGVVGSRGCTHYGKTQAFRFAYQLAKAGYTVISGLARGIDEAAHKGALKAGGRTLAVLGSGMRHIYPPQHEELAGSIAESGALVSEYPMERQPDRTTFPYRNRIISGLSLGVMLVEAGLKSGAMHTADAAMEQGRSVFAMPGRIDSPSAQGCHKLIKEGAVLTTGLEDILEELGGLLPGRESLDKTVREPLPPALTAEEKQVLEVLSGGDQHLDLLCRATQISVARMGGILLGLELKKAVKTLPGQVVTSCVDAGRV